MKYFSPSVQAKRLAAAAAFCFLAGTFPAHSQNDNGRPTLNIDFGPVSSPLFSGTAAQSDNAGTIWNAAIVDDATHSVTASNLVDSFGNVTNAALSVTGVGGASLAGGANPTNNALLQDYLYGKSSSITVNVTNLRPYSTYRWYVYAAGSGAGQGAIIVANGSSAVTDGSARGHTFVQGVNYGIVTAYTGGDGSLKVTIKSNSSTTGTFPVLNGLQIQQATASIISPASNTDAFDVSQGTVILDHSPTQNNNPAEPAIGGTAPGTPEPNAVLFRPGDPPGTVVFIEFKMPSIQTIKSIGLYSASGTSPRGAASRITLWAYNSATNAYDIKAFEIYPSLPYSLTTPPPGAAVENGGNPALLAVAANIAPVTTDRFRIELEQIITGPTAGVRLAEIDGFTTENPNLPLVLPIITTASTATGQVGKALRFQVAASNNPQGFLADGLPDGLSIDPDSGLIAGTPTTEGTFDVAIGALNGSGQGPTALLRFIITGATENIQGINILSPPSDLMIPQNAPIDLYTQVNATPGTLAKVDFSIVDAGGTATSLFTSNLARSQTTWMPTEAGDYSVQVTATDTVGQTKQLSQPIHVTSAAQSAGAQVNILSGFDESQSFVLGSSVQVAAAATDAAGNPLTNVQFYLDGREIPTTMSGGVGGSTAALGSQLRTANRDIRLNAEGDATGGTFATAQVPISKIAQLLTAVLTSDDGINRISKALNLTAIPGRTNTVRVNVIDPANVAERPSNFINVDATSDASQITEVALFADDQRVATVTTAPYVFTMPVLRSGRHLLRAVATDDKSISTASDPVLVEAPAVPLVSVTATDTRGNAQTGDTSAFTVTRVGGNTSKKLRVNYRVQGSVSGVDFEALSGSVKIKTNRSSAIVTIHPLQVPSQAGRLKGLKLKLLPGAGYTLGPQAVAKVKNRY